MNDCLKVEFETGRQGAFARQLGIQRQWVQPIIAVSDVQHANRCFGSAMQKPIADKGIELPEIIARNVRRISLVRLLRPHSIELAEKSRGMIEPGEQDDLV